MAKERKWYYGCFKCNYRCIVAVFFSFIFFSTFLCFFPTFYNLIKYTFLKVLMTVSICCICVVIFVSLLSYLIKSKKESSCETLSKRQLALRFVGIIAFVAVLMLAMIFFFSKNQDYENANVLTSVLFGIVSISLFSTIESLTEKGIYALIFLFCSILVGSVFILPIVLIIKRFESGMNDIAKIILTTMLWTASYYISGVLFNVYKGAFNYKGVRNNEN